MSAKRGQSRLRVGDRVRFEFGQHKATGVIAEELGGRGIGGRRLFGVEMPIDPDEPMRLMFPEDELEVIPPGTELPLTIEKQRIMEYLVYGLTSILRSNLAGGKNQPRVWLCLDQLGNVTYTFYPERGVIGGQVVPARALYNSKVFKPKREEVVSFLESFGLNRQEAEKVISEVGTAP